MNRRFLKIILICLAGTLFVSRAAIAGPALTPCQLMMVLDYQHIGQLMPLMRKNFRQYSQLKLNIDKELSTCPKNQYPIHHVLMEDLSYLDFAIVAQNTKLVQKIVRKYGNTIPPDNLGQTPLHVAAYYGNVSILKTLIKAGYDVNAKNLVGETPLMSSSGGVQQEAENTKYLVEHGAKIFYVGKNKFTPLTEAITTQDVPAVRYLIQEWALKEHYKGAIPVYTAAEIAGNKRILKILRDHGVMSDKSE